MINNKRGKQKSRKRIDWKAKSVILEPVKIKRQLQNLLLTELATLFYDESCRLQKKSNYVSKKSDNFLKTDSSNEFTKGTVNA